MIVKSLDHLSLIAKKVADNLSYKDCVYLIGEIGVGKTTLARSLINYLQKKEKIKTTEVLSPTFNLLHEYDIKKYKIMHYDLYRIKEKKELENLNIFSDEKKEIKIIEWPNLLKEKEESIDKLEIYLDHSENENEREIKFVGSGKWKNFKNEL